MEDGDRPTDPIMQRLRAETREAHAQLEGLPFSKLLVAERLSLAAYVGQLRAFRRVHESLESALDSGGCDVVAKVWRAEQKKTHLLADDLSFLKEQAFRWDGRIERASADIESSIDQLTQRRPVGLLGYLYVLEGVTLDGQLWRRHVRSGYGFDRRGFDYYTGYGREAAKMWRAFGERMDAHVTDPSEQDVVIEAARDAFTGIRRLLVALVPPEIVADPTDDAG